MLNPLIRQSDYYVVLEPNEQDQILTAEETLLWLIHKTSTIVPMTSEDRDQNKIQLNAQDLLQTASELEFSSGKKVQWYTTSAMSYG